MDEINQRRTSAASAGFHKPTGAMNSAFDTGAATKTRGGKRVHLPPLDPGAVSVVKGPPPVEAFRCERGKTKYDFIFIRLTADDMGVRGIPKAYKAALSKALQKYMEHHPELKKSRLVVRNVDEGTVGVWRIAKQEPTK